MMSIRLDGFLTIPPFSHEEVELHDDAFTESLGLATLHQLRADGSLQVAPRHLVTNRQRTQRQK